MHKRTRQCRLEAAFRQELLRLIDQYLSSPQDATLGKIVRTLVNFQQVRATVEELCQRTCVAVLPGNRLGIERQLCWQPKRDRTPGGWVSTSVPKG
jgi:hypothetical protein